MTSSKLTDILKLIGLGEKLFLDLDGGDPVTEKLVNEIIVNSILTNLNKQQRVAFYQMVEDGKDPQHIYQFLLKQIPDLDDKLTNRIKSELRDLLIK